MGRSDSGYKGLMQNRGVIMPLMNALIGGQFCVRKCRAI
jgi:hypothetical protein